ncbi:hypothetical protein [Nonomuraea lactucae]|nr:hypothetical protein [Nonomuraea lactucae]
MTPTGPPPPSTPPPSPPPTGTPGVRTHPLLSVAVRYAVLIALLAAIMA